MLVNQRVSPRRRTHLFAPTPITMIGRVRSSTNVSTSSGACLAANIPPPPMTRALNRFTFFYDKSGWRHVVLKVSSARISRLLRCHFYTCISFIGHEAFGRGFCRPDPRSLFYCTFTQTEVTKTRQHYYTRKTIQWCLLRKLPPRRDQV